MTIGPGLLVFLIFLILKLTGVIAWSWLWVTSPLWIGAAIAIPFLFVAGFTFRKVHRSIW